MNSNNNNQLVIIKNSIELPFNLLHNDFIYPMKIGDVDYNSVTQYIYYNLFRAEVYSLDNDLYNNIYLPSLLSTSIASLPKKYRELSRQIFDKEVTNLIKTGYFIKFFAYDYLRDFLLTKTKKNRIIYVNPSDRFLGVDENGHGLNIVGKALMDVRELCRKQWYLTQYYNSYIAYRILEQYLRFEKINLDFMDKYLDVSEQLYNPLRKPKIKKHVEPYPIDISRKMIHEIIKDYGVDNVKQNFISYNDFLNLLKFENQNSELINVLNISLQHPHILLNYAFKTSLEAFRSRMIFVRNNVILETYLAYKTRSLTSDIEKNSFIEQVKSIKIHYLQQKISKLYLTGKIKEQNAILYTLITEAIQNIAIPSNDDIEYFQTFNFHEFTIENKNLLIEETGDDFIFADDNKILSYYVDTEDIGTSEGIFKSVKHFVDVMILKKLPTSPFVSTSELHKELLQQLLSVGLDKKFGIKNQNIPALKFTIFEHHLQSLVTENKNRELYDVQFLLYVLQNETFIYEDRNRYIGSTWVQENNYEGGNFIGLYYDKISKYFNATHFEHFYGSKTDLKTIVENDLFISTLLKRQVEYYTNFVKLMDFFSNDIANNVSNQLANFQLFFNIDLSNYTVIDINSIPKNILEEIQNRLKNNTKNEGIIKLIWYMMSFNLSNIIKAESNIVKLKTNLIKIIMLMGQNLKSSTDISLSTQSDGIYIAMAIVEKRLNMISTITLKQPQIINKSNDVEDVKENDETVFFENYDGSKQSNISDEKLCRYICAIILGISLQKANKLLSNLDQENEIIVISDTDDSDHADNDIVIEENDEHDENKEMETDIVEENIDGMINGMKRNKKGIKKYHYIEEILSEHNLKTNLPIEIFANLSHYILNANIPKSLKYSRINVFSLQTK